MSEAQERVRRLQEVLSKENVDLAAIGPTTNMKYLLGDAPYPDERLCLLFICDDELQMVAPKLNAETIVAFTDVELIAWEDAKGPESALQASLLGRKKIKRLAIDGAMRADFLLPLVSVVEPEEILSGDPMISSLRARKSPEEVEALSRAAQQADRAMQAAIGACKPGISEKEVAWEAEGAFRKEGAEEVSFTIVAAGANGARPHHHSGEKALEDGDGVVIDIGASVNGYKSDITRVVYLGEPPEEFCTVYETVLRANKEGRAAVRPGVRAEEVDAAARRVIEEAGYGEHFVHRTGHGIGLDTHEAPWIMHGNERPLEPGMAFSVEPGIYLPGRFGVRIEDIVVVTDEGVRTLTGYDHELAIRG